ncbi:hypothetical protein PPACK8108_LOCUS5457 [Phakopsora pachyrhizi]|uniref:Uncharacterized protein n=1 Tax=Phakopsora pachyrhizi TaxID=170000 RepID=A0AAV0APF1_PHAPC|nr:hypothetical protein PPACK8108_LOCUS5457 [Phakopsora pachyrhizi]
MTPETNSNGKHPIQLEPFKNFNPSNNHTQLQHQQQLVGNYQDPNPINPVINNSSKRHCVSYITDSPLQVAFKNLASSNCSINCLQQLVKKPLLGLIFLHLNQSNHYQKDQNLQPPLDLLNLNGTNPSPTQRRTTQTPSIQNAFPVPSNNHQAEERSDIQGLQATVIDWISRDIKTLCPSTYVGASGAPGTRLLILGWNCKLLKVHFSEIPEVAFPSSSPNLLRLIDAMGLILDLFQDSACNRFSIKNYALVITRRLVRCNHQHIPELFKYLTQDSSSPQNATLLGLAIDVSLRLRVGREIVKGLQKGLEFVMWLITSSSFFNALNLFIKMTPGSVGPDTQKDFFPVLVSAAKSSKSETWETALLFFKTLFEDEDSDVLAKVVEEISLPLKTGKTSGSEHKAALITILEFVKPDQTMTCLMEINSQKSTTSNYATKTVPASRIMLVAQDVGEINSLWSLLINNYKMHLDEISGRIGAGTMTSESLDEVSSLQNQLMDLVNRTICWMNCNDENFTEGRGNCRKFYAIVEPINQFAQARYAALQAAQPLDMTDIKWLSELWTICHDEDERNASLALDLWVENGFSIPPDCLNSLLLLLEHHTPLICKSAAKSLPRVIQQHPQLTKAALNKISARYQAKELLLEYNRFGMIIPESIEQEDPWKQRVALANALYQLALHWNKAEILPLFSFLVEQSLRDRHKEVQTSMLAVSANFDKVSDLYICVFLF